MWIIKKMIKNVGHIDDTNHYPFVHNRNTTHTVAHQSIKHMHHWFFWRNNNNFIVHDITNSFSLYCFDKHFQFSVHSHIRNIDTKS